MHALFDWPFISRVRPVALAQIVFLRCDFGLTARGR